MPSRRFPPTLSSVPFQITGLCSPASLSLSGTWPFTLPCLCIFLPLPSSCQPALSWFLFLFISNHSIFPLFQLLSQTAAVLLSACFLFDYRCVDILVGICESESRSVASDSLLPCGLYSLWDSPGQDTGVGSLSLLQGIFPTQGSNPGLPHCRQILYQLSHKGSPRILEWVSMTPHQFCVFLQSTHSDVSHPVQLPCF